MHNQVVQYWESTMRYEERALAVIEPTQHIRFTTVGVEVENELAITYTEYDQACAAAGLFFGQMDAIKAMVIGDLVRLGERQLSDRYEQAMSRFNIKSASTVANYVWLSKAIEPRMRFEGLTFKHYHLAVRIEDRNERMFALRICAACGISAEQLAVVAPRAKTPIEGWEDDRVAATAQENYELGRENEELRSQNGRLLAMQQELEFAQDEEQSEISLYTQLRQGKQKLVALRQRVDQDTRDEIDEILNLLHIEVLGDFVETLETAIDLYQQGEFESMSWSIDQLAEAIRELAVEA